MKLNLYRQSCESSLRVANELRTKFIAWVKDRSFSLAHFVYQSYVDSKRYIALTLSFFNSRLLKGLLVLAKFSKRVLYISLELAHSIRNFIRVSKVKFSRLVKFSSQSIYTYFVYILKKSFYAFKKWYKLKRRYKGIAIVTGLEFIPLITEAVKELIPKYKFRLTMLSSPVQALAKTDMELDPLFFPSLTPEEKTKLAELRNVLLTKTDPSLLTIIDLLRVRLGKLFLVKKQYDPEIFTIYTFVLTPEEAKWLREKGCYLIYLQSTNPAYVSSFCSGYTFGALSYNEYKFSNVTVGYLKELFERILNGEK